MDTDATTLDREADSLDRRDTLTVPQPTLVVAWCRAEPGRVGEVVLIPDPHSRRWWTLGRGSPLQAHDAGHLSLTRQRPGENIQTGAFRARWISRRQLRIRLDRDEKLAVENVGALSLSVNHVAVKQALIGPGDVLQLGRELVLLCVLRPHRLPPSVRSLHAFGEADEDGLIGESPAAWATRDFIDRAARRSRHALLLGESGVGKELIAQAIHRRSPRGAGPLVARNAATMPAGLIDAELFGSARGYPDAGSPARRGLVGAADGGTLFFDEIGELPEALQSRLLRLMDAGAYHRLGEASARTADLRIIGATNRPLSALKSDVAARFPLRHTVAGLSERAEDIPLLVPHLLHRIIEDDPTVDRILDGSGRPRLSPTMVVTLLLQAYPGNVRSLEQTLWEAADYCFASYLDLPPVSEKPTPVGVVDPGTLRREDIEAAMRECDGVKEQAWRKLGLRSRYQLYRLLKEHGID